MADSTDLASSQGGFLQKAGVLWRTAKLFWKFTVNKPTYTRPQGTIPVASQINGCSVCVDLHPRMMRKEGETDERLFAVAAWRDAPYFTEAERAALALTEAVTRLSDREDPVPDAVWDEAARHYDEKQMAGLVLGIAMINVWNRLNVATRQVAGEWVKSAAAREWVEKHT